MPRTLNIALSLAVVGLAAVCTTAVAAPKEVTRDNVFTTAYGWWDNTPRGSSDISNPVIHNKAGGTGTYADPITVAVGHTIKGKQDILDIPEGTKMYIPAEKRYFIVEDTCGDGRKPQNGPCHRLDTPGNKAPKHTTLWIDMWVGGEGSTHKASNKCEDTVTDLHTVIENPKSTYPVARGDILHNGVCDHDMK